MSGIQSHPNDEQMWVPLIRCIPSLAPCCTARNASGGFSKQPVYEPEIYCRHKDHEEPKLWGQAPAHLLHQKTKSADLAQDGDPQPSP